MYSRTGPVLYRPQGGAPEVWARPFSLRTLKATGEAFQILKGATDVSMADDGTLVYVDAPSTALTLMNRKGVKTGSIGEPPRRLFLSGDLAGWPPRGSGNDGEFQPGYLGV